MIPTVRLVKSGIATSRLGFGTSRLHYLGKRDRQRLLAAAADFGIMHFDTAPAYGDGICEAELGQFVRGQRERFVIVTKYGIPPDPFVEAWPSFSLPLRAVRAVARRMGFRTMPLPPLTPAGLRASVEHSLRRLGTDRIDILFLHEPSRDRIPSLAQVTEELQKLRNNGVIRAFGLAGGWSRINDILAETPALGTVIQTAESEWLPEAVPDITYGAIAAGPQRYFSPAVAVSEAIQRLRIALERRPSGVVLISTTRMEHLRHLVEGTPEAQH
jgi:aryl-alcohol dehydrogenase-like predicted oxidoreductase